MSDEIDWKAKCRKVAEWMGEIRMAFTDGDKYKDTANAPHFHARNHEYAWPDYTLDDAAAWRLATALVQTFDVEVGDGYVRESIESTPLDTEPRVIAEHDDQRKLLVLAACQLIDEGIKPREST